MTLSHDFRQQHARGYWEASENCRYCGEQKTDDSEPNTCEARTATPGWTKWTDPTPTLKGDAATPQPQTYTDFQVQKLTNGLKWAAGFFAVVCLAVWVASCTIGHTHKQQNIFGVKIGECHHSHTLSPTDVPVWPFGHEHSTTENCD